MLKRKINLQRFADGGEGGSGGQGGNAGNGSGNQGNGAGYTYEQLDEIANSRAERASRSALADFFRKQGMSEEEVTAAITDYKTKKKESQPDIAAIERERDSYKQKVEEQENKAQLQKLNVNPDFMDYVLFEVKKKVTDKLPFDKAAEQYLKENPKYAGQTYKVTTGVSGGGAGGTENKNDAINSMIRGAFGR